MRVLIVEDEVRLANNVAEALRERCGYAVDCAANGADGAALTEYQHYDLLMLDLMLPGLDGLSIVQQVRRRKDMTPILILTARDERAQVIELLNAGADDYLTKPFDLGELLARAKALIRRGKGASHPELTVGRISVNTLEQTVRSAGSLIVCLNTSSSARARSSQLANFSSTSTTTTGSITPTSSRRTSQIFARSCAPQAKRPRSPPSAAAATGWKRRRSRYDAVLA